MRILQTYFSSEEAVAATEFAMIAPFLILLMVGIMDLGSYIRDRMKLEQISRASADYVLQGGSEENIQTDVLAYFDAARADTYTVTTERVCTCEDGLAQSCSAVSCGFGDYSRQYIQVTVDRTFSTLFPYPGISPQMSLSGFARLRLD
ncbi:MAG: TadE/TadG family type IV pilus assembly protein [Pseudomonadota bacterium]